MRLSRWLVAMHVGLSSVVLLVEAGPAGAQTTADQKHRDLQNSSWEFLALESGAVGLSAIVPWLGFDTPTECRWCEPTGFDKSVRSALVAPDPLWVGYASHGVSLGLVPVLAIGGSILEARADDQWERAAQDAWIITNAFLLTTALGNTVKKNVARRRPAFYYGVSDETEAVDFQDQQFLSFYSLDTAWAFSVAASGATLAYLRGYESAPWLLGGGAVLATTAGVMRISADMHWATDVATGAFLGTLVGVGLPLLLHGRASQVEGVETQISPQGLSISGVF
jgi:membrane-associated phospholipid phosphatase